MAGIVFGCVVPHPPLLVPDIGRGQEKAISSTVHALELLTQKLADAHPDTLVIVSPHGHSLNDAMGVATCKEIMGTTMRTQWGSQIPDFHFSNDPQFVEALMREADSASIPLRSIGPKSYDLDHGVLAPMYFLVNGVKGVPLVPLTFSWLSLEEHYGFGQAVARAAEKSGRKVAFIASGDLSHRLIPEAPAGYDPQGEVFDRRLVEAVKTWDIPSILGLDFELIERAGECGLRSILILLGALSALKVEPEVLSYEGPFGVGYLVAACHVRGAAPKEEMHPVAKLAKETVECFILEGKLPQLKATCKEMKERAGVFVSLKKHGQLRGCIGTFEPTRDDVAQEIIANAISSATQDPRFPPVSPEEVPYLDYSVDILTKPEPAEHREKLDPRKYGMIVEARGRRGLLLPDLEGVDTVEQQIEICCHKAGLQPGEPVKLYCFQVKRYK